MWSVVIGVATIAVLLCGFGRRSGNRVVLDADAAAEGGVGEFSELLKERGPMPISRLHAAHQRVTCEVGGFSLVMQCYWPPRVVPRRIVAMNWDDNVGWVVDVDGDGKQFRVYASRVEVRADLAV